MLRKGSGRSLFAPRVVAYGEEIPAAAGASARVGGANQSFVTGLRDKGIEVTRYEFKGDYYSLPNILPLLAMPSKAELVDLIMQRDLPRRPTAKAS